MSIMTSLNLRGNRGIPQDIDARKIQTRHPQDKDKLLPQLFFFKFSRDKTGKFTGVQQ
jgi:hypothetical protein